MLNLANKAASRNTFKKLKKVMFKNVKRIMTWNQNKDSQEKDRTYKKLK